MKIASIMDPIERVLIHADTTFGWMLAAQARGHELFYVRPADLVAEGSTAACWATPVTVRMPEQPGQPHYELGETVYVPLSHFDVVWMRRDPPFDTDYLYSTYILELAEERGDCWVMNHPRALRDANEKAFILHFPELTPRTMVTRRKDRIKAFMHEEGGRCIVKPLVGHGGEEVFMAQAEDLNLNTILEVVTRHESRYVMVQTYVPEARKGDKRIILVDGEPLGAVLRVPSAGELRGNLHVGGRAVKAELTARERQICEALRPRLQQLGLYFVGIDILGDYLTEVNVTSPTGIREMSILDGQDYTDQWIVWIERRLSERRPG